MNTSSLAASPQLTITATLGMVESDISTCHALVSRLEDALYGPQVSQGSTGIECPAEPRGMASDIENLQYATESLRDRLDRLNSRIHSG